MTQRLSHTTLLLHWSVAFLMVSLLALGIIMYDNQLYELYPIHKSLGMLVLPLAIFRVYWRYKKKWPQPAHKLRGIWTHLAKASHVLLLSLTLLIPISGILMSLLSGRGLSLFSYPLILAQKNPQGQFIALSKHGAKIAHQWHFLFSDLLIILLCAHIIASIIHHFFLKDDVLNRMIFFYKK